MSPSLLIIRRVFQESKSFYLPFKHECHVSIWLGESLEFETEVHKMHFQENILCYWARLQLFRPNPPVTVLSDRKKEPPTVDCVFIIPSFSSLLLQEEWIKRGIIWRELCSSNYCTSWVARLVCVATSSNARLFSNPSTILAAILLTYYDTVWCMTPKHDCKQGQGWGELECMTGSILVGLKLHSGHCRPPQWDISWWIVMVATSLALEVLYDVS